MATTDQDYLSSAEGADVAGAQPSTDRIPGKTSIANRVGTGSLGSRAGVTPGKVTRTASVATGLDSQAASILGGARRTPAAPKAPSQAKHVDTSASLAAAFGTDQ
jgi:hypothetical protein